MRQHHRVTADEKGKQYTGPDNQDRIRVSERPLIGTDVFVGRYRVVSETFGHLRNAVPEIQQIRRDQVPDLVWAERADPCGGRELVEPVRDVVRPQRLPLPAGEHVPRHQRLLPPAASHRSRR
jgi:hypothetical protein